MLKCKQSEKDDKIHQTQIMLNNAFRTSFINKNSGQHNIVFLVKEQMPQKLYYLEKSAANNNDKLQKFRLKSNSIKSNKLNFTKKLVNLFDLQ